MRSQGCVILDVTIIWGEGREGPGRLLCCLDTSYGGCNVRRPQVLLCLYGVLKSPVDKLMMTWLTDLLRMWTFHFSWVISSSTVLTTAITSNLELDQVINATPLLIFNLLNIFSVNSINYGEQAVKNMSVLRWQFYVRLTDWLSIINYRILSYWS